MNSDRDSGGRVAAQRVKLAVAVAILTASTLAGCISASEPEPGQIQLNSALPPVTVIDSSLAISTSAALFVTSPIVIVAAVTDRVAMGLAAETALVIGAPLLTVATSANPSTSPGSSTPPTESTNPARTPEDAGLSAEIARLRPTMVITVGAVGELSVGEAERHDLPADARALNEAIGGDAITSPGPASIDDIARSAASTNRGTPDGTLGPLPRAAPDRLNARAVLTDTPDAYAAAVIARAAGVQIIVAATAGDILADPVVISALSAETTVMQTLLIGASFAEQPDPDWSVRAANGGYQLTGGGQRLFGSHRFVALYGTPHTPVLGVLGEQDETATIERATQLASEHAPLSDRPIVATLEIIATVAAGSAGSDGNYSNELDPTALTPLIDAAAAAGVYVVLDLQPGRTDFLTQAKQYRVLLERPNVGLALDPEWRLGPDQVHLEQIGTVDASEINATTTWLADLIDANSLPPKMLVLHEFRTSMITNRSAIDTTPPQLEFLAHVDGQGSQPDKAATYTALLSEPPVGVAVGWKNFIDEDEPVLTPTQTMTTVNPIPDFISYQ